MDDQNLGFSRFYFQGLVVINLCSPYVTGFAKRIFIRAIINTEKSYFKILITVYLENVWCLAYGILYQSIVKQGNSAGALFDGLLPELPTILDSFFTSTTSDYIVVLWICWCLKCLTKYT